MWWRRIALALAYVGAFALGGILATFSPSADAAAPHPVPVPVVASKPSTTADARTRFDVEAEARLMTALAAARAYSDRHRDYAGMTATDVQRAAPALKVVRGNSTFLDVVMFATDAHQVTLVTKSTAGGCYALRDSLGGDRTYARADATTQPCTLERAASLTFDPDARVGWQTPES